MEVVECQFVRHLVEVEAPDAVRAEFVLKDYFDKNKGEDDRVIVWYSAYSGREIDSIDFKRDLTNLV
jgi:hypothetical protein